MNPRRSASVGALPREKKHFVSRNESTSGASLDVRCACQYFQCDSLLPERVNPATDSRPTSAMGFHSDWSSDHEHMHSPNHFQPVNNMDATNVQQQMDQMSSRSYNVGGGHMHMDVDRISVRSVGGGKRVLEASSAQIDLSFVDKYPELEEVARSRGLVVRRISDANEMEMGTSVGTTTFMAGQRGRQMSVGRISTGGGVGGREADAWSTRSVTSLRRISRSPSKSDLFVADINIPTAAGRHERPPALRSASTSRRTSNVDLSHFASHRGTPALLQASVASPPLPPPNQDKSYANTPAAVLQQTTSPQQQLGAPKFNLITPTPTADLADMRADFERATASRQRSQSPSTAVDYRIAKRPVSTDYMRPDENKENMNYSAFGGELMPQNRPIDVSKYSSHSDEHVAEITPTTKNTNDTTTTRTTWRPFARAKSPKPTQTAAPATSTPQDPLQQIVAELEDIAATRNVEDVYDNIRMRTTRPPSIGGDSIYPPSLHPTEETNIRILSAVPTVDIDKLVQSETQKAVEARMRSKSPPPSRSNRAQSPHMMDTLQLPSTPQTAGKQREQQTLKRQRTPERNMSPEPGGFSKKSAPEKERMEIQTVEMHFSGAHDELPLQNAPPEVKASYASRFKSIFTSNKSEELSTSTQAEMLSTPMRQKSPSPMRQKSPSPMRGKSPSPAREKSPSPRREKSPSPMPSKLTGFTGFFSKSKPTPMSIVAGNTSVITRAPEKEAMSVKVTETFSLKVDEMDQYNTRPSKPPPSSLQPTPPITAYSSREDFIPLEQSSTMNISDAFAPVVMPALRRDQFMAGNRTLYSSEIDTHSRRSESELNRATSKEQWMGSGIVGAGGGGQLPNITKGTLISVPINIGNVGSSTAGNLGQKQLSAAGSTRHASMSRPPSADGRFGKSKLVRKSSFVDGRTQSQDRAQKLHGSHEDLFSARMTKTVSFNFDERQSRLSEFESSNLVQQQQQKDKRDFLERTYFARDHEYEPIAAPSNVENVSATQQQQQHQQQQQPLSDKSDLSRNIEKLHEDIVDAETFQNEIEERYFSSEATTPRTDSRTDYEIHTSQVDSSALEELPLKPENRKKGFMASAQDRTRKMQAGIRSQAGKIKTKLRTPAKKPAPASPKAKERKRFKAPEFSKIKMPEIKRPDFKRPEFAKFNKPDMSKFKLPEKFPTIKLKRSKSFKENEVEDEEMPGETPQTDATSANQPQKKRFDFNFGTYPRAFRKKKKPLETQISLGTETGTGTGTEGVSVIPSTETQPSVESSSSPQGDRGPGPVRSRWADKFSDVSYNDSEGSRYRRYGSEQESFDRESSLERRMKDDLEETESEAQEMGIMGRVADPKQFAEFDEENRAIHEISKMRAGEFRRRPMVHQDSDLRSEDSKEVEGWTDKEIEKNKLLRQAEMEAEASYMKYVIDDVVPQETQSVASSGGKKVVMEEIDDDEFFLRKRGVSEDNIELRQYISDAIREGYDKPFNTLDHVGETSEGRDYRDYDIPPPKPKRLNKTYRSQDTSQDLEYQRSDYGDDDLSMSQNGSDFFGAPKRPMRKGGRNRSKYSMDSQDFPVPENLQHVQYFDDDEEYLRPPRNNYKGADEDVEMNDLDISVKQVFAGEPQDVKDGAPAPPAAPQAPRRRKRDTHDGSMDKDSYINGFGGRSVSNSRLQPTEDVIVYRTEHEYPIPLAAAEKLTPTMEARKSRSTSRYDEDDRTSRGAESLGVDNASSDGKDKYVIDMMENDGYAVVRKEQLPKPTPPARRKKFSRSPGERFSTIASSKTVKDDGTPPPPERPPPPRAYTPSTMEEPPMIVPRRKSITSIDVTPQILEDDYEEPEALQQEERNLQSGDIVNKMKFRPLPAPPRPPREKRQRNESRSSAHSAFASLQERDLIDDKIATSSTADSYDPTDVDLEEEETRLPEVEVSTQTDPLPDDFECEEFEITDDMRIIEPRINKLRKTLDELLREEELRKAAEEAEETPQLTEEEQLARGLQRFRDANQRSVSERSKASSQAGSKTQSRPPTPSAVVIERRVSTPIPSQQQQSESMLEASLIVRPIDDLDLEEEALRREGLLTDSSQQSKSDLEATSHDEDDEESKQAVSDYSIAPSSDELDAALNELRTKRDTTNFEEEKVESDQSYINEYEFDEKRSDDDVLSSTNYSAYAGEEVSEKEEEETEQKTAYELQTESEEIATTSAASEDELKLNEQAEEPKAEKENLMLRDKEIYKDEDRQQDSQPQDELRSTTEKEIIEEPIVVEEPPLPPPRRKSATAADIPPPPTLTLAEQPSKEVTPVPTVPLPTPAQLPTHLADLEVERLRVHALQAGQIMVSQLHGAQISAEDLECKSGNLIVKNIALPEGFIEDIVERVRTTDRSQLLTAETQTSLQASREKLPLEQEKSPVREVVPPPKPPRQRDLDSAAKRVGDTPNEIALQQLRNYDEETQTDPVAYPANVTVPPPVYTTTEYLQSIRPPMGFYNLQQGDVTQYGSSVDGNQAIPQRRHHPRHYHHRHRRCDSSCSECDDYDASGDREETRSHSSHSRRSRSSTRPPTEPQTVGKAGQQFISACSLAIVNMINRLTAAIKGSEVEKNIEQRHIPTIVALFVVISLCLIVYMLSGRNVHTHHWDFFNLPGNGGRPT